MNKYFHRVSYIFLIFRPPLRVFHISCLHYCSFHESTRYLKIDTPRKTYFRRFPICAFLLPPLDINNFLSFLTRGLRKRTTQLFMGGRGSQCKQLSKVAKFFSFGTRVSNIDNFALKWRTEKNFMPPRDWNKSNCPLSKKCRSLTRRVQIPREFPKNH